MRRAARTIVPVQRVRSVWQDAVLVAMARRLLPRARWVALLALVLVVGCQPLVIEPLPATRYEITPSSLSGRVVAVGIPGASAISPVGVFLPGGPIRDKPEFAVYTEPGRILDPRRLLVASSSNFRAPWAQPVHAEGAILSIDPCG